MERAKDHTRPEGPWEFDDGVTAVFDDMLERSIPQYHTMRALCFAVGKRFVKHGTAILDMGCSRGGALGLFVKEFGAYNHYVGVDVSEPMLAAARERFAPMMENGLVRIRDHDLRQGVPDGPYSLVLCVLTLQFTPMEYRTRIVSSVAQNLVSGGALILVEKVMGASGPMDELLTSLYLDHKRDQGYSEEEIQRKRLALEGRLVPMATGWNENLLARCGFHDVECFWRCLNFAGWVAVA